MSGAATGPFLARLRAELEARRAAGLLRSLSPPAGLDLCSNDYLGYASDPGLAEEVAERVRSHGIGAGAARLLGGQRPLHAELEASLASFSGREAALLFSSGYALNIGLLPAIATRQDTIFSDALNHASLLDGIVLSRARRIGYPHQDLETLDRLLGRPRRGRAFIVTESLFSMDGDLTDLEALCDLAERHDALVIVDEAHATGLYGGRGSGRVEALGLGDRVLCTIHTGGKALGSGGAWVAGERALIDHLINACRSFIFSTAPVPALAAALLAAVGRLPRDTERVAALHRKAARLRDRLRAGGIETGRHASPILPVILGGNERAVAIAAALRRDGFDVRAVRPPTVPEGTARLRVTVRAPIDDADLDRFADRLVERLRGMPA